MRHTISFDYLYSSLEEHQTVFKELRESSLTQLPAIVSLLHNTLSSGGTIFWCGNGGSAADSQHLASELIGRFTYDRPPFRSLALSTDTSALTAISNDYQFTEVFSRQLQGLAKTGDALICLSTSGKSQNIISAALTAKSIGVTTICLTGFQGGNLLRLCDHSLIVHSESTARIQEAHIFLGHCICDGIQRLHSNS